MLRINVESSRKIISRFVFFFSISKVHERCIRKMKQVYRDLDCPLKRKLHVNVIINLEISAAILFIPVPR